MLAIDKALYTLFNADVAVQTAGSLGEIGCLGVFANGDVPKGQSTPYLRFLEMAAPATNVMGNGPTIYEAVYTVFAVDSGNDKTRADALAQRVKKLLHKTALTMAAPFAHMQTLIDGDVDLPVRYEGETFEQVGKRFRIWLREDQ